MGLLKALGHADNNTIHGGPCKAISWRPPCQVAYEIIFPIKLERRGKFSSVPKHDIVVGGSAWLPRAPRACDDQYEANSSTTNAR